MSKLDWVLGRTEKQMLAKEGARRRMTVERNARKLKKAYGTDFTGEDIGKRISRYGKHLTFGITFPIFGFLFFGIVGAAIGIAIALLYFAAKQEGK